MKQSFYRLLKHGDDTTVYCPSNDCNTSKLNGQIVKIIDFGRKFVRHGNPSGLKPGIYVDQAVVKVRVPEGYCTYVFGGHLWLELAEYENRKAIFDLLQYEKNNYIEPLPEMPFQEGDMVHIRWDKICPSRRGQFFAGEVYSVVFVQYEKIDEYNSIYAIRNANQPPGCFAWMQASELELIKR